MSLQYIHNKQGVIVAVQVPITTWELLKTKYPDIDDSVNNLPAWQIELLDARLKSLEENPERVLPIETLIAELDRPME